MSRETLDILDEFAARNGWTNATLLCLLAEFIEAEINKLPKEKVQSRYDVLVDFLREAEKRA